MGFANRFHATLTFHLINVHVIRIDKLKQHRETKEV